MMEWYQILSYYLTGTIRIFLCLCITAKLLNFLAEWKKIAVFSLLAAVPVTVLLQLHLLQFYLAGAEVLLLAASSYILFRRDLRITLFLIIFYEIWTALWDFLVSAGLGVLFRSQQFTDLQAPEHLAAIWIMRAMMIGIFALPADIFRLASAAGVLGMLGVIALTEQTRMPLDGDLITQWLIQSMLILMAVLVYNLRHQYETEKSISDLKAAQAELLERDYRTLNDVYSSNAKLFHDLHNHLEVLDHYLTQGRTSDALDYLKDLHTPIHEITQAVWTGDESVDYLINSKIALAKKESVDFTANVEFPRHMDIRSCDLTAILGNLLDNALDGAMTCRDDGRRFIILTVRRINAMLVIKVENSCDTEPVTKNGELLSGKPDKNLHGWGLKSARTAAERYEGTVETSWSHHVFRAVATLSYKPV